MSFNALYAASLAPLAMLLCASDAIAHDGDGVRAGRNAAGQLVAQLGPPLPFELGPSPYPDVPGFASAIYGFESAPIDEPDEDFYTLDPAALIDLVVLDADAAIVLRYGLSPLLPGQSARLGAPAFDIHPVFQIPIGRPGDHASISFRFHDAAGHHPDSDPFTIDFVIPCASPCVADYDASGGTPDAADIDAYFNDWLDGAPCADADASGGTPDSTDIDVFFTAWLAGGC